MGWKIELAKIVVPATLGFIFGRFQTSYTDKISRTKDIQNELLKAIRSCTSSAIDYHSQTLPKEQWIVGAIHLKNQLWRIRTDVDLVNNLCKRTDGILQERLIDFFDAVTQYPFEANELPDEVEGTRFKSLTVSSEKLVHELSTCRPRVF